LSLELIKEIYLLRTPQEQEESFDTLIQLVKDKFGNYVVQRCLEVVVQLETAYSKESENHAMHDYISQFKHRMINKLIKLFGQVHPELVSQSSQMKQAKKDKNKKLQTQNVSNYAKHVYDFLIKKFPEVEIELQIKQLQLTHDAPMVEPAFPESEPLPQFEHLKGGKSKKKNVKKGKKGSSPQKTPSYHMHELQY